MKKIILSIAVMVVAGGTAFAQKIAESAVPKTVVTSYQKSFVGSSASTWEQKSTGDFQVDFIQNHLKTTATFDAAGKLTKTEQELYITQMPGAILDYVFKKHNTRDYVGATKVTEGSKVTYIPQIKVGENLITMKFDSKYTLLTEDVTKAQ